MGTLFVTSANSNVAGNIITEVLSLRFKIIGTMRKPQSIPILDILFSSVNYMLIIIVDISAADVFDLSYGLVDSNDLGSQSIAYVTGVAITSTRCPACKARSLH